MLVDCAHKFRLADPIQYWTLRSGFNDVFVSVAMVSVLASVLGNFVPKIKFTDGQSMPLDRHLCSKA